MYLFGIDLNLKFTIKKTHSLEDDDEPNPGPGNGCNENGNNNASTHHISQPRHQLLSKRLHQIKMFRSGAPSGSGTKNKRFTTLQYLV